MTDHDRGAYAPPSDAPLTFETFDARSRSRRPMPMTLIGSLVVLAVLGAALLMFYRSGPKRAGAPPPPVGQAIGSIKSAPAASAQPRDPAAGLDVYSPQNVPTKAPSGPAFAPAPEQPMPRPAPKPSPVVGSGPPAPAPGLKVETVKPAPAHAVPAAKPLVAKAQPAQVQTTTTSRTVQTAAAKPAPVARLAKTTTRTTTSKTTVVPAKPSKPTTLAAAKPAPAPAVEEAAVTEVPPALKPAQDVGSGGGAAVQIGAFSTALLADKGYRDVAAQMSGQMSGRSKRVEPLARDGRTLYRTTVGGFGSRAEAQAFCAALKARGGSCIVRG